MAIISAIKSIDTVRSNTTFSDDPDLSVTLLANTTYIFECFFLIDTRSVATLRPGQFRFTAPGHTLGFYTYYRNEPGSNGIGGGAGTFGKDPFELNNTPKTFSTITTYLGQTTSAGLHSVDGIITVGGTGGTFALNWASTTSGAITTTVQNGGWMLFQSI